MKKGKGADCEAARLGNLPRAQEEYAEAVDAKAGADLDLALKASKKAKSERAREKEAERAAVSAARLQAEPAEKKAKEAAERAEARDRAALREAPSKAAWAKVAESDEVAGVPDPVLEARYRKWRDGLDESEREQIYDYTSQADVNQAMRGEKGDLGLMKPALVRGMARRGGELNAALKRAPAPDPDLFVYRVLDEVLMPGTMGQRLTGALPGQIVRTDGFGSSTANPGRLVAWAAREKRKRPASAVQQPYWMEIRPKQGAFVDSLSAYKGDQSEFLMPTGTYMRYVGQRKVKFRDGEKKGRPGPEVVVHQWEEVLPSEVDARALRAADAERARTADAVETELTVGRRMAQHWAEEGEKAAQARYAQRGVAAKAVDEAAELREAEADLARAEKALEVARGEWAKLKRPDRPARKPDHPWVVAIVNTAYRQAEAEDAAARVAKLRDRAKAREAPPPAPAKQLAEDRKLVEEALADPEAALPAPDQMARISAPAVKVAPPAPAVAIDWAGRKNMRMFWMSRVAKDEKAAEKTYGDWAKEAAKDREFAAALDEYTRGGGAPLNTLLRTGVAAGDGTKERKQFAALERRLRDAPPPPDDLLVYRKVDLEAMPDAFRERMRGLKAGDVEEFRGMSSASLSPSAYEAPTTSMFMEIRPVAGAYTELVSPGSKDFMLRPNVKLKFVGVSKRRIDRSMWPAGGGKAPELDKDLPRVIVHMFEEVPESEGDRKALAGGAIEYAKRTYGEVQETQKAPPAKAVDEAAELREAEADRKAWADLNASGVAEGTSDSVMKARYQKWLDGLDAADREIISKYTVRPGISNALRGLSWDDKGLVRDAVEAGKLDAALARAPKPEPGTFVYRVLYTGQMPQEFDKQLRSLKPGEVTRFEGFLSTSSSTHRFRELLDEMPLTPEEKGELYQMEILPKRGAYIDPASAYPGKASEFLMPTGSYLRYLGTRRANVRRGVGRRRQSEVIHQWEEVVPATPAEVKELRAADQARRAAQSKSLEPDFRSGGAAIARREKAEEVRARAEAEALAERPVPPGAAPHLPYLPPEPPASLPPYDWASRKRMTVFQTSGVERTEAVARNTYREWAEDAKSDQKFVAALDNYARTGLPSINRALRTGAGKPNDQDSDLFSYLLRQIEEAPPPPDDLIVYRTVDLTGMPEGFKRRMAGLEPGDVEQFRGISSASLSPSAYEAPASSLFMEIRPAGGAFTEMVVPGAKDFMLRPNVRLKFVGVSKRRIDRSMWPEGEGKAPESDRDLPWITVHMFEEVPQSYADRAQFHLGLWEHVRREFRSEGLDAAEKEYEEAFSAANAARARRYEIKRDARNARFGPDQDPKLLAEFEPRVAAAEAQVAAAEAREKTARDLRDALRREIQEGVAPPATPAPKPLTPPARSPSKPAPKPAARKPAPLPPPRPADLKTAEALYVEAYTAADRARGRRYQLKSEGASPKLLAAAESDVLAAEARETAAREARNAARRAEKEKPPPASKVEAAGTPADRLRAETRVEVPEAAERDLAEAVRRRKAAEDQIASFAAVGGDRSKLEFRLRELQADERIARRALEDATARERTDAAMLGRESRAAWKQHDQEEVVAPFSGGGLKQYADQWSRDRSAKDTANLDLFGNNARAVNAVLLGGKVPAGVDEAAVRRAIGELPKAFASAPDAPPDLFVYTALRPGGDMLKQISTLQRGDVRRFDGWNAAAVDPARFHDLGRIPYMMEIRPLQAAVLTDRSAVDVPVPAVVLRHGTRLRYLGERKAKIRRADGEIVEQAVQQWEEVYETSGRAAAASARLAAREEVRKARSRTRQWDEEASRAEWAAINAETAVGDRLLERDDPHYGKWLAGLTKEEREGAADFAALSFRRVNALLRGYPAHATGRESAKTFKEIGRLDAMLKRAPPPPPGFAVYRTVRVKASEKIYRQRIEGARRGEVIRFDGFLSTSTGPGKLVDWIGKDKDYLMEIKPRRGGPISAFSRYEEKESEFLMPEGSYLRYVGRREVVLRDREGTGGREKAVVHQWEEVVPEDTAEAKAMMAAEAAARRQSELAVKKAGGALNYDSLFFVRRAAQEADERAEGAKACLTAAVRTAEMARKAAQP